IRAFIKLLTASPEERAFAVRELNKSRAAAVPYLLDALRAAAGDPTERLAILQALQQLGPEAIGPLVAALDSTDTTFVIDVLDTLRKRYLRYAREIVPHLW